MEQHLDLIVKEPQQGTTPKKFVWNKQELLDFAKEKVSKYENLVYTEENIKDLKKDISDLNKQRKAINDKKISIKKQYMEPYAEFENDVKDVLAIFDEGVQNLKAQQEEYETYRKQNKKKELIEFFDSICSGTEEILTFDKVFDPRYLNVTVSMKKAKEDIESKVKIVRSDLETIENLEDDVRYIAKSAYEKTMSMSIAMSEITKYRAMKKKEEDEKARREAEKKAEEQARNEESTQEETTILEKPELEDNTNKELDKAKKVEHKVQEQNDNSVVDPFEKKEDTEKIYCTSFKVYGTKQQIMDLKNYINSKGLKIGKVD